MAKLKFETNFLIISAILLLVLTITVSYLISFLADNLSKTFVEERNAPTIAKFNIKDFENLKFFRNKIGS